MATALTRRDRGAILAGLSVSLVGCALGLATIVLVFLDLDSAPWWPLPGLTAHQTYALRLFITMFGVFTLSVVAGLVLRRQPRSPFSWTFTAVALLLSLELFTQQYAIHGLLVAPGSVPLAAASAQFTVFVQNLVPALYIVSILLFPDGKLPSRSWRVLVAAVVVVMGLDALRGLDAPFPLWIGPGQGQGVPVTGPPELWPIGRAFAWAERWTYWGIYPIVAAIALSVGLRLRAAKGDARLQLRWFTYAIALGAMVFAIARADGVPAIADALGKNARVVHDWGMTAQDVFIGILVPLSIGIAIMRYRLYDIDVVISRTIVYGGLAAFVTVIYGLVVAGAGGVLGGSIGLGPVPTVIAIAVIALLLEPVRARLRELANVAIYGKRANPYEVLSDFGHTVSNAVRADVLLPRMAKLVRDATHASSVQLWVRVGDRLHLAASAPDASAATASVESIDALEQRSDVTALVPVFLEGERLGALVVRKQRGDQVTTTERRLLTDLASQAGLVFGRFRLIEELRESRGRLVAAHDEERRKIERDLHDGAQQRFVNAMLSVGMAKALDAKGEDATALLTQATSEMQAGLIELRALARGVHPPLLTDEGLPAAIASLADRSPILTSVHVTPDRRYTEPVEATAYFVVAEALANAAKHSRASSIAIRIDEVHGRLRVEVRDDGIGGVDPKRGSGIVGLRDRAAAIGGRLEVDSDGNGTIVRAELPCA